MKIAHIAPPWIAIPPKNYGGTEIVLYNLIEEQIAQGHDVILLDPGDAKTSGKLISFFPQSLLDAGVPWPAHLKAYYHFYRSVEYVKDHNFDVLHTHLSSAADMYLFALTAHLGVPHVMTLHSRFPFDRVGSWTGEADNYYMEWASSIPMVAISEHARDEVPHRLNFVGVVHHGLPMAQFRPSTERPQDFFVWLGRIVEEKGTHLAIEAAKKADVPLVLAGNVDRHVPDAVQYFEKEIRPHIDQDRVKYIGPVNMKQKIDLLSKARALLNPITWEEPFGMVMIEAMALGCPVISFARGAAPELIVPNKTGFLVHNTDQMISHIPRVHLLDRMTVRSHIEQHFSASTMVEKYLNVYKKVIATNSLAQRFKPSTVHVVARPTWVTTPVAMVKKAEVGSALYQPIPSPLTETDTETAS